MTSKRKVYGPGNQRPLTSTEVVEEAVWLSEAGMRPHQVALALKRTPEAVAAQLYKNDLPELARVFQRSEWRRLYDIELPRAT